LAAIALVAAGAGLAGCDSDSNQDTTAPDSQSATATGTKQAQKKPPSATPTADPTASATAAATPTGWQDPLGDLDSQAEPVAVTRTTFGCTVKVTAHPIQSDGQRAALVTDYELQDDPEGDCKQVSLSQWLSASQLIPGPQQLRLFDLPSQTAWLELPTALSGVDALPRAGAFRQVAQGDGATAIAPSALNATYNHVSAVTLHPAPNLDQVDLFVPKFGVIPAVPVVVADGGLDRFVAITGEPLADQEAAATVPLRRFLGDYEGEMYVVDTAETTTLAITSDVLFATDEYELTPEAQDTIERAVDQIKAEYDSGTITVIGHTDDVADESYNQTLSENRANSVAAAITPLLGDAYTVTAEGRGESEPAVEGTSTEARTLNRRVEIQMSGVEHVDTQTQAFNPGDLMPADYPTSQGGQDWLEFEQGVNGMTKATKYKIKVDQLVRTDNGLVGYLRLAVANLGEAQFPNLTSAFYMPYSGRAVNRDLQARGYGMLQTMAGTVPVALLTPEGRLYGYDFQVLADQSTPKFVEMVCTDAMNVASFDAATQDMLITMIWPDPGTATVTIDVEGTFRLQDVPVSDDASALGASY
jgi:outer membrane protein OmpA-like peptidoglycan-associated protein